MSRQAWELMSTRHPMAEPVAIAVVPIRIIVVMINGLLGICHLLNKSIDSAGEFFYYSAVLYRCDVLPRETWGVPRGSTNQVQMGTVAKVSKIMGRQLRYMGT